MLQPDVIVIGSGSVGTYFDKYGKLLAAALKKHETPLMTIPPIIRPAPQRVRVYGAYDYAVQSSRTPMPKPLLERLRPAIPISNLYLANSSVGRPQGTPLYMSRMAQTGLCLMKLPTDFGS